VFRRDAEKFAIPPGALTHRILPGRSILYARAASTGDSRIVAEIVKRTFVEFKDQVVEKDEWEARDNPPEARGWTSYCFFLQGRAREDVEKAIRAGISRTFVQVVPSARPEGVWVRGARYELEAALAVIERPTAA
jgi:hypothetical protein